MVALTANPVECPNDIVPTLVRLERAKEREDVRREALALSIENVFEISGRVGDWELNTVRSGRIACDSYGVDRLVERRSQTVDDVVGEFCEPFGQGFGQLDLVELVSTLRIGLNDTGVWLFLEEFADSLAEFGQVSICARDPAFWAIEWVRHDKNSE